MPPADRCIDNEVDEGSIVVKITASDGATIILSSSSSDPKPKGKGTRSVPVSNDENTTVSLPTAGETTFFLHVAAEDGYSENNVRPCVVRPISKSGATPTPA